MRRRLGWILTIALALSWAAGLRAAIAWRDRVVDRVTRARRTERDDSRKAEVAVLVSRLPRLAAPAERVDAGNVDRVDARDVIALLRAQRTSELREALEAAQGEFERGARTEQRLDALFAGLSLAEPSDLAALDDWVAADGRSFSGYVARAAERLSLAMRRAKTAAHDRNSGRRAAAEAHEHFALARRDLERAIELRPLLVPAHSMLLAAWANDANENGGRIPQAVLSRALAACPACIGPRIQVLGALRANPVAQRAFAEESQASAEHSNDNPRLRMLLGYLDFDDCVRLAHEKLLPDALAACDRALATYPAAEFFFAKAVTLSSMGRYPDAVDAATRVLSERPYDVPALVERARAYFRERDWEKGAPDLRLALELSPSNESGVELLEWTVDWFDATTRNALMKSDLDTALDAFGTAARILPERRDFEEGRAAIAARLGRSAVMNAGTSARAE